MIIKYFTYLLFLVLLLTMCNSPTNKNTNDFSGYQAYISKPHGGEVYAIGDTLKLDLHTNKAQPLQVIWITLESDETRRRPTHIKFFTDFDMYHEGMFFITPPDTMDSIVTINIGWVIPEKLYFYPDSILLQNEKLNISCHHFQIFDTTEIFKVKAPITIVK